MTPVMYAPTMSGYTDCFHFQNVKTVKYLLEVFVRYRTMFRLRCYGRSFKIATLLFRKLLIGYTQRVSLKGTKHLHIPRIHAHPNRLLSQQT